MTAAAWPSACSRASARRSSPPSRSRAATSPAPRASLGINRSTLYYRLRKHGLEHLLPTKIGVGSEDSAPEAVSPAAITGPAPLPGGGPELPGGSSAS
jgi:hypothetical protein